METERINKKNKKVNFLDELGLLSRKPIDYIGQEISPFEIFSKIVHPKV